LNFNMASDTIVLFDVVITAKDVSQSAKLCDNSQSLGNLADILSTAAGGAIPERVAVFGGFRKPETQRIIGWFADESEARSCCEGLEALGEINGVPIAVQHRDSRESSPLHPNSNWIRILGFSDSVDEKTLRKHARKCGLKPKRKIVRIDVLGTSRPNQYGRFVDVECKSRKIAVKWIKKLKLTILGDDRLWADHRPEVLLDNGQRLPRWARIRTKEQYLEDLGKEGALHRWEFDILSASELETVSAIALKEGEGQKCRFKDGITFKDWKTGKSQKVKVQGAEKKAVGKLNTKRKKLRKKVAKKKKRKTVGK